MKAVAYSSYRLTQLTKILVFASLLSALAFEAWQGRFLYPHLPALTLLAAIAATAGARYAERRTVFAILLVAYWVPVLFVMAARRPFLPSFFAIWSGALVGLLLGDRDRLTWSFPERWRLPLMLWTLTIALGWPLIALREMDFQSLALFDRYRVSNTGIGGSPTMMVSWVTDYQRQFAEHPHSHHRGRVLPIRAECSG